jgi:hypothetical protein
MTKVKQTWHEKRLAREENSNSSDSSSEEEVGVTSDKGESTSDKGNSNPDKGNSNKGEDQQEECPQMEINMVFTIPAEFHAPTEDVAELTLGTKRAVSEKSDNPGAHMRPLFIRGHQDGTPILHMLVDRGASINILPLTLFKKLGHVKSDLKPTNLSLSVFAGDPMEAKGIICKELIVGSKTVPTAFFMVDVMGCHNMLLG